MPQGFWDTLQKAFSHTSIPTAIVEQWSLTIPAAGEDFHEIRYLPPDGETGNLTVYLKEGADWRALPTEAVGSYLTFSLPEGSSQIAILSTMTLWWVWIIAAVLLCLLLWPMIHLIRKLRKKRREKKQMKQTETTPDQEEADDMQPKKRKKTRIILISAGILLLVLLAAALILCLTMGDELAVYSLLQEYAGCSELSMTLDVDAEIDGNSLEFSTNIHRTNDDGAPMTIIESGDLVLYYTQGAVFLENGTAYGLGSFQADQSQLLDQVTELYQHLEITKEDSSYTITAEGEDAAAILQLLIPDLSFADTETILISVETESGELSRILFYADGTLAGEEALPFLLSASLTPQPKQELTIPHAVLDASGGEFEPVCTLDRDLMNLLSGWLTLMNRDTLAADISMRADCGPLVLDETFSYTQTTTADTVIRSIGMAGYNIYFTEDAVCDKNGNSLSLEDTPSVETAKILELAYDLCLSATPSITKTDAVTLYTLELDAQGMKEIAHTLVPESQNLDLSFHQGTLQVTLCDGAITDLAVACSGSMPLLLQQINISLEANMAFLTELPPELPAEVIEALTK